MVADPGRLLLRPIMSASPMMASLLLSKAPGTDDTALEGRELEPCFSTRYEPQRRSASVAVADPGRLSEARTYDVVHSVGSRVPPADLKPTPSNIKYALRRHAPWTLTTPLLFERRPTCRKPCHCLCL